MPSEPPSDNPDLIVTCVIGDGEAEKRVPWRPPGTRTNFLKPGKRWCCPASSILHLNGYKIANPTILARISSQ